jgi:hypothetical protein
MVHIKGATILGSMERIREHHGEEGLNKIIDQLHDEEKAIFKGAILASQWYPLTPFARFLEIDVKLFYAGDPKGLIASAEEVVEKQLRGIYRMFIKIGSPEFVVKGISAVHKSYFKGVDLKYEVTTGRFVGKYIGYEQAHGIMQYSLLGFFKKAMTISGAKNVRAEITTPLLQGKGYLEITVTWDPR